MTARARGDAGAATVFGMALVALLLVVGIAGAVLGSAVLAHRRAQSAADLAALAAARAVQGEGDPCTEAARVSGENDARLTACTVAGWIAHVEVSVEGPRLVGLGLSLPAQANAGPASP